MVKATCGTGLADAGSGPSDDVIIQLPDAGDGVTGARNMLRRRRTTITKPLQVARSDSAKTDA